MIHPLPPVLGVIEDAAFTHFNEDTSKLFIICMMPRPGSDKFFHALEWTHYSPENERLNAQFELMFTHWRENTYAIASIPLQDRAKAEEIAATTQMRLADGVPVAMRRNGDPGRVRILANVRAYKWRTKAEIIDEFPLRSRRAFTLENLHVGVKGPIATSIMVEGAGQSLEDFWGFMLDIAQRQQDRIKKNRAEHN